MKRILLFGFAYLLTCFSLTAQTDGALSLQEAVDYALQNSLEVQQAKIELADAEQAIQERLSSGIPKISGTLDYNYFLQIPTSILPPFFPETETAFAANNLPGGNPIPIQVTKLDADGNPVFGEAQEIQFGLKHNATAGVQLSSLIFDWTYLTAVKAAREFKNFKNLEFKVTEREVRNRVTDAYLPALILRENVAILDSNLMNLNRLRFETNESYKAGFVEQLDVDRLTLSISNLEVQREALLRQYETVENGLKLAMNLAPDAEIIIADNIEDLLSDPAADVLAGEINLQSRPEIDQLEKALELADLNIDIQKAGYYPSVSGFISYQQQYQGDKLTEGNWFPTSVIGLSANIPIYSGGLRKTLVQRARLEKEKNVLLKTQFERGVTMEIQTARINYQSAKDRVANQEDNVELAERIYDTTKIKYKEGVGSSIELTTAEQQLYQTQQNYTNALYDLLQAKFALERAVGITP